MPQVSLDIGEEKIDISNATCYRKVGIESGRKIA